MTADGTAVTIHADDHGHLVAVDDESIPLAGATVQNGIARIEVASDGSDAVGAEVCRQVIARAHERGDRRLTLEAEEEVLESVVPEVEPAVRAREPGRVVLAPDHAAASPLTLAPASSTIVAPAERVKALFEPEVVAVFGATDRPGSIGRILLENLDDFEGEVLPVTDRSDEVLGLPTVADIAEYEVDLVIIALPADAVEDAVQAAIEADTEAIAILSAGFAEADAVGERRQAAMEQTIADAGVTAVGPNAFGVMSTATDLNATFAPTSLPAGPMSIVSHSGAMITAVLDWADSADLGIQDVVSLGNGIDLTAAEVLRYWGRDPETKVIVAYLEDLPDGRAFVEAARDVTPTTPVVALKSGRTRAGSAAARSHTGAMAGDDAGYEAAFDAAGVIRVPGQDALFDTVAALSSSPLPGEGGVAVVTNAGGPGVIATDAVDETDLALATYSEETVDRLSVLLPEATDVANPLDILGDADVERFVDALEIVLGDPNVGAVILTSTPHPLVSLPSLVKRAGELVDRYGIPVYSCFPGVQDEALGEAIASTSISDFSDAGRAARTLSRLVRYTRNRREPRAAIDPIDADRTRVASLLDRASADYRTSLGVESLELLEAYGVPSAMTQLVQSPEETRVAVERVGGEAVLKVIASDLSHKTDVGGVRTGVTSSEAEAAYQMMVENVETSSPNVSVDAVAVQEPIDGGVEVLVGVTHHERFGPLVTVGLGGVFVEHLNDVAHGLAPMSEQSARTLLSSLEGASLLEVGPRGEAPPDLNALAASIARLSRLGADHESINSLEVNPLIATPDGPVAVDLVVDLE